MKKQILIFLLFIFSTVYSQSNFEWKTVFGGNYSAGSNPVDCVLDESGNLYLTGYEIGPVADATSLINIYTIKINASGTILWKKSYGVGGSYEDDPYSICLDETGNVFVAGTTSDSTTGVRMDVILKYSNNGTFIWDKKFNIYNNGSHLLKLFYFGSKLYTVNLYSYSSFLQVFSSVNGDSLLSLSSPSGTLRINDYFIDKNGSIYINWVGNNWPSTPPNLLSKYNNSLNLIWSVILDSSVTFSSISVDNNSNIYLSGIRGIFLGGGMMNTVKMNSTGNIQWVREYIGSINSGSIKNNIDSENNLYVLGASRTSNLSDSNNYALIKYSASGDSIWVKKELTNLRGFGGYPIPTIDFGLDIYNNIYVYSSIYPTPPNIRDYRISKYSPNGNLLKRVYNNNYINMWDVDLFRVDKNGVCYIAGETEVNPNWYDFTYIVKISGTVGINNQTGVFVKDFSLSQNYPNPFNPSTHIKFFLPKAGTVKIIVYDITGKKINELADKYFPSGEQSVNFDAGSLAGGIYFCKATYENYSETKKMMLIK